MLKGRSGYGRGVKAGLIAGAVWGGVLSLVIVLYTELNRSQIISSLNQQLLTNPKALNGSTPEQYINMGIQDETILFVLLGVIFGALIGMMFSVFSGRFLSRQKYPIKGMLFCLIFWLLYLLGFGLIDAVDLLGSLVATLLAGYLLGYFFERFKPPNQLSLEPSTSQPSRPSSPDLQP